MTKDLIDRYLRAVRDHLPRAQQDDIIDELADNLHSRFEDEAAARGRPLQEAEEVAILKAFGHPMAVAARYRGDERSVTFGRRLIGPELFPTYMKVLTVNVIITIIVVAITFFAEGNTIWSGIYGALVPLALQFTIVTAIFIVIDQRWVRDPDGWDPRTISSMGTDVDLSTLDGVSEQLIGKANIDRVPLSTSILEFAFLAIALTVWLVYGVPASIGFMAPGPGWADLFVPATIVFVGALLTPLVTLIRPSLVRFRVVAHIVVDAAIAALALASLAIGSWVVLLDPASATADETALVDLINSIVRVSLAITVVITALSAALEVRRLVRMSSAD